MSESLRQQLEEELIRAPMMELGPRISELISQYGEDNDVKELVLGFVNRQLDDIKQALEPNAAPETVFADVFEFVDDWLLAVYPYAQEGEREVKWTRFWWKHPEAVLRLTSLWQRFEFLKVAEPATYMETFLRVHADYHMKVLMADGSVFDHSRREDSPSIPLASAPIPKAAAR